MATKVLMLNSREAKFLLILQQAQLSKLNTGDPMLKILFKNVDSLIVAVDKTPEMQEKVREILNFVKDNWSEGV